MNRKKIRGPSRSRVSIRARAVRANVTRHYEAGVQRDLEATWSDGAGRTAPRRGA